MFGSKTVKVSAAATGNQGIPEKLGSQEHRQEGTETQLENRDDGKNNTNLERTADEVMQHHLAAIRAKDENEIADDYPNESKLFHTDATMKQTTVYTGPVEIAQFFKLFNKTVGDTPVHILKAETGGYFSTLEWENIGAGFLYAYDVFYIVNGKIQLQTITTVSESRERQKLSDS